MATVYINCPKCSEKIPNQLLAQHYKICNGQQQYTSPKSNTGETIQKPGFPDTNNLRQQLQEMKNRKAMQGRGQQRTGQQGPTGAGAYKAPKLYFNAQDSQNEGSDEEQLYTRPIKSAPGDSNKNEEQSDVGEDLYTKGPAKSKTANLMNQVRAELSRQTEQLYQEPKVLLQDKQDQFQPQQRKATTQQHNPEVDDMQRVQCQYCERFFTPDRIEKHKTVCQMRPNNQKKRKQFDSAGQRLETDNPEEKSLMQRVSVPKPKNIYETVGRIHSTVNRLVTSEPVQAFGEGTLNFKAEYDDVQPSQKHLDAQEANAGRDSDQQKNIKQPEFQQNEPEPQKYQNANQGYEADKSESKSHQRKSGSRKKKHHSSRSDKQQELDFLKTQLMQLMQQKQQFQPQMPTQQYMVPQMQNPYMQPQQPMLMAQPGIPCRFCINCGMQYLDQARFCGNCGTPRAQLQ